MIRLYIENYCHECSDFEPEVEKIEHVDFYGNSVIDTDITCKHEQRCKSIYNYLRGVEK